VSEQVQERRRDYENWHLDKRVNIGHLLTTLIIGGGVFVWAMNMDGRVTRLEAQQEASLRTSQEIKAELQMMNRKMDRLIESLLTNEYRK